MSLKTKAAACITTSNLSKFLPDHCIKLDVKNTLFAVTQVSRMFYPKADIDYPDTNLLNSSELKKLYPNVNFGKNVLIGKNVSIGSNCLIGHNTIIEKNVIIGDNCSIGSNTIIRNTILKNHVKVLDGCVVGKKGFGFFPNNRNNYRFPQIGIVLINDYSEIGCGSTIDRGSISNTVIGKNTYLDNQIHIAHNVKIGENCIINTGAIIEHDVKIGDHCHISTGCKINGNVFEGL